MEKLFHVPDSSGVQEIEHFEPAVKTSPGPGAVGVTAARANRESNRSAREQDIMFPARVFKNESRFQPERKTRLSNRCCECSRCDRREQMTEEVRGSRWIGPRLYPRYSAPVSGSNPSSKSKWFRSLHIHPRSEWHSTLTTRSDRERRESNKSTGEEPQ